MNQTLVSLSHQSPTTFFSCLSLKTLVMLFLTFVPQEKLFQVFMLCAVWPNRTKQDQTGPNRTKQDPNRTRQDQTSPLFVCPAEIKSMIECQRVQRNCYLGNYLSSKTPSDLCPNEYWWSKSFCPHKWLWYEERKGGKSVQHTGQNKRHHKFHHQIHKSVSNSTYISSEKPMTSLRSLLIAFSPCQVTESILDDDLYPHL